MKKCMLALLLTLIFAGNVTADGGQTVEKNGPEFIAFKAADNIQLKHWKHQKSMKSGACNNCHRGAAVGKIDDWGKEFAHLVCIGCHDLSDKGPTKCKECHKEIKK